MIKTITQCQRRQQMRTRHFNAKINALFSIVLKCLTRQVFFFFFRSFSLFRFVCFSPVIFSFAFFGRLSFVICNKMRMTAILTLFVYDAQRIYREWEIETIMRRIIAKCANIHKKLCFLLWNSFGSRCCCRCQKYSAPHGERGARMRKTFYLGLHTFPWHPKA